MFMPQRVCLHWAVESHCSAQVVGGGLENEHVVALDSGYVHWVALTQRKPSLRGLLVLGTACIIDCMHMRQLPSSSAGTACAAAPSCTAAQRACWPCRWGRVHLCDRV